MSTEGQHAVTPKRRLIPASLLLFGLLVMLFFAGIGRMALMEPDEGRYTEIPREMLATGQYVLPHLNGVLYFEKPPLYYWLNALSIKLFGLNEFAARFWSAVLGVLGLWLVFRLADRMRGRRAAWLSVIVLGTSPLYLAMAHIATIDMTLTFFFTLTMVCFYFAHAGPDGGRRRERLFWYGMFAGSALTVMSKGLIGIVLPGAIIFLYILLTNGWALLKRVPWVTGILLFLAIAAPWHILAAMGNEHFLYFYFVREHFLRYLTKVSDRYEPFWFFLPVLLWGLLPWTSALPSATWEFLSRNRPWKVPLKTPHPLLYLWLWGGFIFLFFSKSDSKLIPYILPALPAFAIIAALFIDRVFDEPSYMRRSFLVFVVLALAGTALSGGALLAAAFGLIAQFSKGGFFPWLALAGFSVVTSAIAGIFLAGIRKWKAWVMVMTLCASSLFAGIWTAALHVERGAVFKRFAVYLNAHLTPGERLFSYRYYPQTIPVYTRRTMGVAAFEGEQTFGASNLPPDVRERRFPNAHQFSAMWKSPVRIYCVTDRSSLKHLEPDGIEPVFTIMYAKGRYLLTNHPPAEAP